MNITSIINVDKVEDIPNALRELVTIVENDIKRMGCRANSIGNLGGNTNADFDYQIDSTNYKSISEYFNEKAVDFP